jgi:hypothetical protein
MQNRAMREYRKRAETVAFVFRALALLGAEVFRLAIVVIFLLVILAGVTASRNRFGQ